MTWQDVIFGSAGATFCVSVLGIALDDEAVVPRRASVPYSLMLVACAYAHASLGFMFSMTMAWIGAILWGIVAVMRAPKV